MDNKIETNSLTFFIACGKKSLRKSLEEIKRGQAFVGINLLLFAGSRKMLLRNVERSLPRMIVLVDHVIAVTE